MPTDAFEALLKSAAGFVVYRLGVDPGAPAGAGARVEFVSPSLAAVMGIPIDTPFGHWFDGIHADDRERVRRASHESSERCEPFEATFQTWHAPAGEWRWVHAMSHPVVDAAGHPESYNGMIVDVTAQQLAEQDARQLRQQLENAQRLETLGLLAGGIAHDFNNILTVIGGNATLLRDAHRPLSPETVAEFAGAIEHQVERAAELTAQLLGYARRGSYERRDVDLGELASHVVAALTRTRKDVDFVCRRASGLWVHADAGQLERVLMNLAVNALDAMPDGGQLELSLRPGRAGGPAHRVQVRDTGCGMPAAVLSRIFDPFYSTKVRERGTGLGLSASLGIVEGFGGDISVASRPGHGSTFTVSLPAAAPAHGAAESGDPPTHTTSHGLRVLVIDDEQPVRATLAAMLERLGHIVLTAASAQQALAIAESNPLDLILLDLVMPGLSGAGLVRQLRAVGGEEMAFMVCSGYADDAHAREAMALGARGFIHKPVRLTELRERLAAIAPTAGGATVLPGDNQAAG